MELPTTDQQLIQRCQQEWEDASRNGSHESAAEGLRLVWALVHSCNMADVDRGLQFSAKLIDTPDMDSQYRRELVYLRAVGKYRSGKYLEARQQLEELLKIRPDSHQARSLKKEVDDAIVRDGLIGVGVVGGVLGLAALIVGSLLSNRR